MDKQHIKGQVKSFEEDKVRVVASTETKDREGEVLPVAGWELGNFKKNPVLLWSHQAHQLPIGKVLDVFVEGKNLIADAVFAGHQFAQEVKKLVQEGFIKTVSVGFLPLENDANGNVIKQELLELSFVNVPANPEAAVASAYKSFQAKLKEMDYDSKPEETDKYIRIPTGTDCKVTATIDISVKEGIKALYCGAEKKVRTYLFLKAKGWTMEKAKKWVSDHSKGADKILEITEVKEGRIISERNRGVIRVMVEACEQAISSGKELLDITQPPEKKGVSNKPHSMPRKKKVSPTLRALKLVAKATEVAIHKVKEGGE